MGSARSKIETVQQLYAAMGQPSPDGALALLTDDVEFIVPGPEGLGAAGTWRGALGVRECLRRLRAAQENLSLHISHTVADERNVVVRLQVEARVLATGRVFESEIIHFFEFEGDRISRLVDFFDTAALQRASTPA
ncbi:MAG TPA: nuclear transport factor 2 family protein [Polyangiaceae bacterium]|nr:nuclear transport factor 2 family protein [Polyangiaceae bacterium]